MVDQTEYDGEVGEGLATEELEQLFAPRRIAVIGASINSGKLGSEMFRSLNPFRGEVVGVNSRSAAPARSIYQSMSDAWDAVSGPIDLAMVCVPAQATAQAIAAASDAGVRAFVVCSGGFGEVGEAGKVLQNTLKTQANQRHIRILGPNTSGFIRPGLGLTASFVPAASEVPAGNISVVATSGGMNHAFCFQLANAGFGVSLGVGLGNCVDVDAADVLQYLRGDDATGAVILHVEAITRGQHLTNSIAALTERVPVIALITGRNDVTAFAQTHTGALATSWRTTSAALRQAGAVVVDDERAAVTAAIAISRRRLPPRKRPGVAVVTAQAGPGLLIADRLCGEGIDLPEFEDGTRADLRELLGESTFQRNPVDTGRPSATFASVLSSVSADPHIDLVAVYALFEPDALNLHDAVNRSGAKEENPVIVGTDGPTDAMASLRTALGNIPVMKGPTELAIGVAALVKDADRRAWRNLTDPASSRTLDRCEEALIGPVDEAEAKGYLEELGISTPPRRICNDRQAARDAFAEMQCSLVVKLLDPNVLHKSALGAVVLGVETPADLERALDQIESVPGSGNRQFLLEAMVPPGLDLIVGARRDSVFGPIILLGLGGTLAEVLDDVAIRTFPIGLREIGLMPDELVASWRFDAPENPRPVDRARLAELISSLADWLVCHPEIEDIEVNPLRVDGSEMVALDAVITVRGEEEYP